MSLSKAFPVLGFLCGTLFFLVCVWSPTNVAGRNSHQRHPAMHQIDYPVILLTAPYKPHPAALSLLEKAQLKSSAAVFPSQLEATDLHQTGRLAFASKNPSEASATSGSSTPVTAIPSPLPSKADLAREQAKVRMEEAELKALEKKIEGLQHVANALENSVAAKAAKPNVLETEVAETGAAIAERTKEKAAIDAINNELDKEAAASKQELLAKEREMEDQEQLENDEDEAKLARQEETDSLKDLLEEAKETAMDDIKKSMEKSLEKEEEERLNRTVNEVADAERSLSDAVEVEDVMKEYATEDAMRHDKQGAADALRSSATKTEEASQEVAHRKELEAKEEALAEQTRRAQHVPLAACINTTLPSFVAQHQPNHLKLVKQPNAWSSVKGFPMVFRGKLQNRFRAQRLRLHNTIPEEIAEVLSDGSKAGEVPEPPQQRNRMRSMSDRTSKAPRRAAALEPFDSSDAEQSEMLTTENHQAADNTPPDIEEKQEAENAETVSNSLSLGQVN